MPYTYLIGWRRLDLWYYGVRYAKNCQPSDLWQPYKSSSKQVKTFIAEHGEPDVIQVRRTFADVDSARNYEHKVLKRLKVTTSTKWLNETDNKSISIEATRRSNTAQSRINKSIGHMGKPRPELKGRKLSLETRAKMSVAHKNSERSRKSRKEFLERNGGRFGPPKHSEETKRKMSLSASRRWEKAPLTEEIRNNMCIAAKKRCEKRKLEGSGG